MEIKYVSEASQLISQQMEEAFSQLPKTSGVLFVGIQPIPELKGEVTTYEVRVGMSKQFDESTGIAVVQHVLGKWIQTGVKVNASVFRGVACYPQLDQTNN
jgi:hypothetical protein